MITNQSNLGKHFIHYDPERTDYSVTAEELARIETAGSNLWKDMCLVAGPLGISCLINAIATTPKPFQLNLSLFLNYIFAATGIVATVILGVAWYKTSGQLAKIISQIKDKPKMEIIPSTTNVGSIEATPINS